MNIDIKSEIGTLRVYDKEGSYDKRSPPIFSSTVHYISDHEVYLCNGVGTLSRKTLRTICNEFYNLNYEILRYEHDNKMVEMNLVKIFKQKKR